VQRPLTLLVLALVLAGALALHPAARGSLRGWLQPRGTSPAATATPTRVPSAAATRITLLPTASPATPSATAPAPTATPVPAVISYSYPIGLPGRPLGDGFLIRHGFQVENTWYNPGHWHTGEDWYALEGDTGGALVYAVAAGEVVYAGANYPGRVVVVAHPDGLFSMYGHLDPQLAVRVGDPVVRGQLLGTVLTQRDARAPSHLHFEIRSFLTAREVNGAAPRYGYRCGVNCPPGPGYWPIGAPDLPVDQGWHNPAHVVARRMFAGAGASLGEVIVAASPVSPSITLWSGPPDDPARRELAALPLVAGERHPLLAVWAGAEAPPETGASAYELWYRLRLRGGQEGWAQAAAASPEETGADGRPSSVRLTLLPAVEAVFAVHR
jgi:murein DD-endopeptidase MepM/ murein hydrolase activator NlpD